MSERSRLHSFAENAGLSRRVFVASTVAAALLAAAGCSSPQEAAQGTGGDAAPVKVGLVYSQSGALASYGKQYIEGFKAGLAYATNGTNKVGGRPIEVTEADDAGDPAKAVSAAKDLIGKGVKILAGSTASGRRRCRWRRSPRRTRCCSSPARPRPTRSPASTSTRSAPAGSPTRTC